MPADLSVEPSRAIRPAQTLADAAQLLEQDALAPDSSLYTNLAPARGTKELTKLEVFLHTPRPEHAFAKAAFVGNRGSGKSTYLLHLEDQLKSQGLFTPVHIYLDPSLEGDCAYSDLFLWTVDAIAREFKDRGHPVNAAELSKVTVWFAETALEKTIDWKKEIDFETNAEASAGVSLPGLFSAKLLARLKSRIVGSQGSRKTIREKLQNYATELRDRVNDFLDHARTVLRDAGRPPRLLIVQDNLDRLRSDSARKLFADGGELLTELRADLLYTAPLPLNLGAYDIRRTFSRVFTMPNVKVRLRDGSEHPAGIDGLLELAGKRLNLDTLFEGRDVARFLVEKSGGSVRDLLRLLDDAQLNAQVDGKERIDLDSARTAVKSLSLSFTRNLLPGSAFYPILAEVHETKCEYNLPPGETVADARRRFSELIDNGVVLEYNGEDSWYDVHPAVRDIDRFKDACNHPAAGLSAP